MFCEEDDGATCLQSTSTLGQQDRYFTSQCNSDKVRSCREDGNLIEFRVNLNVKTWRLNAGRVYRESYYMAHLLNVIKTVSNFK